MKIVFVCDTMGAGGAERVISTISNKLEALNNKVTIIMASHDIYESYYDLSKKIKLVPLLLGLKRRPRFFKRARLLRKAILEEDPDIVVSFLSHICIYTWVALRKTKIPFIVSERNDPNSHSFFKKILLRIVYRKANGCVFQTSDAMKWYGDRVKFKSIIIFNPVNLTFVPNAVKNGRKEILISVGRFYEQKNYLFLIKAFALFSKKHPEFIYRIYGDGPLKREIENFIDENNLEGKIQLFPKSKTWHKDEFNAKLFLLGSKYEGMPNALEEALCLGIPSISIDCPIGGPKELKKLFPNLLTLSDGNLLNFVSGMERSLNIVSVKPFIPLSLSTEHVVNEWVNFIKTIVYTNKF